MEVLLETTVEAGRKQASMPMWYHSGLIFQQMASKRNRTSEEGRMEVPLWEKYSLSIEEAAAYFRIGEGKLRKLVAENPHAEYLLWNGNRAQIKKRQFEAFVDRLSAI